MSAFNFTPPSFGKRLTATWIDFMLLVGVYITLAFVSAKIYDIEAYPPPTGMQLYSQRDFDIFWFFVRSTILLTTVYLFVSYKLRKATLGQRITNLRLLNKDGSDLTNKNIVLRICIVLLRLFLITIPGPIVALLFIAKLSRFFNQSLSMALLMAIILIFLYRSFLKYRNGKTRSLSDVLSGTVLVDISKLNNEEMSHGKPTPP